MNVRILAAAAGLVLLATPVQSSPVQRPAVARATRGHLAPFVIPAKAGIHLATTSMLKGGCRLSRG